MDKKLIYKMVKNCFKQYYSDLGSLPISEQDFENLCMQILLIKEKEPTADLYEVINDMVYELLTIN
ncbi:YqzH family protein [Neobacillus sp. PS3-40]|uniref:YqzH family protein n=1 Tax=Neobacillus sp. PS3-40 TaxID=3070679 RepID=UPI0027E1A799|nr:YqzH family protein [Neobacillus sp. PS3-40]WML45204.1 YqzH family protein [Neobacillus sp. PS3-40]